MNSLAPVTLETERLILRQLTPVIYNQVFETYTDEALKVFFGLRSDQELFLEKEKHRAGLTNYKISFILFHLIEKYSGHVIGNCGFHTWYIHHYRAEIGYGINEESNKGRGFMKEALKPIIEYGFNEMNLNRIEAMAATDNVPSLKLLRGFGFSEEGLLKEHYCINNSFVDSVLFSLLKSRYIK